MDEMEMYRLIAAGLETKVEDDSGKAAVRSINLVIDLFEDVKALGEGITEDNAVEIADFLERIVGEVKAFGKSLSNQEEQAMLYVKHFKIMNRLFRIHVDKVEGQFAILPGIGIIWRGTEWTGVSLVWGTWGIAFQVYRKKAGSNA